MTDGGHDGQASHDTQYPASRKKREKEKSEGNPTQIIDLVHVSTCLCGGGGTNSQAMIWAVHHASTSSSQNNTANRRREHPTSNKFTNEESHLSLKYMTDAYDASHSALLDEMLDLGSQAGRIGKGRTGGKTEKAATAHGTVQ